MVGVPLTQINCQCCLKTFDEREKTFIITKKVHAQFKDFTQLKVRKFQGSFDSFVKLTVKLNNSILDQKAESYLCSLQESTYIRTLLD